MGRLNLTTISNVSEIPKEKKHLRFYLVDDEEDARRIMTRMGYTNGWFKPRDDYPASQCVLAVEVKENDE